MSPRHLSARARAAAVLACLLGLGVAFGGHLPTAVADPSGASSDDELAAAQAAEHEQARLISEAEGRLAGLRSELALAEEQVDTAAEDYTEALWRLETAELAHAEAEEAAAEAGEQAIVVRNNLVEAFRAIWREGEVGSLEVITGATDLRDVARRADLNRAVARRLGSLLGETISTRSAAAAARERWAAAGELEEAAAGLALITLEQAYSAQQELEELQAGAEVERAELIGRLAELRQTTVEIEEQREAEREEAARLAEEQRLRDEAEPPAAPSAPGGPPSLAPSLPPGPAPSPPPGGEAPPTDPPSPPASPTPAPSPTPSPTPSPSPAPPPVAGAPASSAEQGLAALAFARARLGEPYQWGGTGNPGWDCSGLTQAAWRHAGINITRTSRSQWNAVTQIPHSALRPGDLLFWASDPTNPATINHVAIYAGGGMQVHSPSPGRTVEEIPVRWNARMMPYAGRP